MSSKKTPQKSGEYWIIKNFLDSLRDADQRYRMAQSDLEDRNKEQTDIEHAIELGSENYSISQLARKLRDVRIARRKAKNTLEALEKIVTWYGENQDICKELERLQGQVRSTEDKMSKRVYAPRSHILDPQS